MTIISHHVVNDPPKSWDPPHRVAPVIVVLVRRVECADCTHQRLAEEVIVVHAQRQEGGGRHRRGHRSWPDFAAQVLRHPSMTRRLALLVLVVAIPAAAVAAALAWAGQLGVI